MISQAFLPNRALLIISIFFISSSCTGFREAFDERVGNRLSGVPERVQLNCDIPMKADQGGMVNPESSVPGVSFIIREVKDSRPDKKYAGQMHNMNNADNPVLLSFEEGSEPDKVVLTDVTKILKQHHFSIINSSDQFNAVPIYIDLEIMGMVVESLCDHCGKGLKYLLFESMLKFRSTIRGEVDFRAALIEAKTGEVLWRRRFHGEKMVKVLYLLKRYHEEALNKAYCNALNSFSESIRNTTFIRAAQGHSPF